MLYSLTEAAKLVIIEQACCKYKQSTVFLNELKSHSIVKTYNGYDYYKKNKLVLTDFIQIYYPEVKDYFVDTYTKDGFYQLKMTEYGIKHIIELINKIEGDELLYGER